MTLRVQDVTVSFGATTAVNGLTVEVARGEIFSLVGPSGCGKSTLLRAIAGLVPCDTGQVSWAGQDLTSVPTESRDIGFMFQDHALFTHRSVADNVGFGLRMRGVGDKERSVRVEELLDLVGLAGFAKRSVERLSGGEAQRVALARALAPQPQILLLDEPLASLDRARREELNVELARLLRELGQTALYVTHDQHEAFAVADRVGVMHAGRLVRVGTPGEVWRDPQTEFVARFVGHDTIIELDGHRFAVRSDAVRVAADATATSPAARRSGIVTACRFHGDRYQLSVDIDSKSWKLYHQEPLRVGDQVDIELIEPRLAPLG